VQVPAEKSVASDMPSPDQIILHVRRSAGGVTYSLNDVEVSDAELGRRIRHVYASRARKVLFVEGEESVSFNAVVHAMDIARGAGMEVIGLVPRATAP
jgi:biopolymer transport protein ExbD